MTTWYTTADETTVDRLLAAWPDAPVENLEVLDMMLDTAREQVIAYAPTPRTEEGTITPGPVTIARRNLIRNPSFETNQAFWTVRGAGTTVARVPAAGGFCQEVTTTGVASDAGTQASFIDGTVSPGGGQQFRYSVSVKAPLDVPLQISASNNVDSVNGLRFVGTGAWERYTLLATTAPNAPLTVYVRTYTAIAVTFQVDMAILESASLGGDYFDGSTPPKSIDGRTYSYAWEGAEHASASVETYRPNVFTPTYPTRYVLAQLRQAQAIWEAGRVNSAGDIGEGGFVFTPRPMDKAIKAIIRPADGKPHAL